MARRHAHHVYVEVERAFNERSRVLLASAPSTRKWWATVFGANSSLPPHSSFLDSIARSAKGLREDKLYKNYSSLLFHMTYHRADHPLYEYLHHFLAARNTRGSTV